MTSARQGNTKKVKKNQKRSNGKSKNKVTSRRWDFDPETGRMISSMLLAWDYEYGRYLGRKFGEKNVSERWVDLLCEGIKNFYRLTKEGKIEDIEDRLLGIMECRNSLEPDQRILMYELGEDGGQE